MDFKEWDLYIHPDKWMTLSKEDSGLGGLRHSIEIRNPKNLSGKFAFDKLMISKMGLFLEVWIRHPKRRWVLDSDKIKFIYEIYQKFSLKDLALEKDLSLGFRGNEGDFEVSSFPLDSDFLSSCSLDEFKKIIYSKIGECLITLFIGRGKDLELWDIFLNFLKEGVNAEKRIRNRERS